ncbi:MAG TPA: hypothetical protein VF120_05495 [Ktedonobacterales bacterium]
MQYVFIGMDGPVLALAIVLLVIGITRVRTPSATGLRRWTWQATQWAERSAKGSGDSNPIDESAIHGAAVLMCREGALRLVWMMAGAVAGGIVGIGLTLALFGTLVTDDFMSYYTLLSPVVAGLYTGATGYALIHLAWRELPQRQGLMSFLRAYLPIVLSLPAPALLLFATVGRLTGRLATYADQPGDFGPSPVVHAHPAFAVIPIAFLALVFACQVALMLRLYASIPIFSLANRSLALAAGEERRGWAFLMSSGLMTFVIAGFSATVLNLLQLSNGEVLLYILYALGFGGMVLTFYLAPRADHIEADAQPA